MFSFLGEHPFVKNSDGLLASRIATAFPRHAMVVTLPGIHATQRLAMIEYLDRKRAEAGLPPLTEDEICEEWLQSVDLIIEDDAILIRPDPENMPLAFMADEMLQELFSKRRIRFLQVLNEKVGRAIQHRGEAWRINPLPKSRDEMGQMIVNSRIAISGRAIYYYNATSGTRWLTYQQFTTLAAMSDDELRQHLIEIKQNSANRNGQGRLEIDFFSCHSEFGAADFATPDFASLDGESLRQVYEALRRKFEAAVNPSFRVDDAKDDAWRNRMYCTMIAPRQDVVTEEALLGLGSEFFMQVEWLPGARLEEGELIFDSVFDEQRAPGDDPAFHQWDNTARGLICNLIQEYGDMEYLNVGRVLGSMATRSTFQGRRDVFVVQIKQRDVPHEVLQIVRMQKWDVRERLDQGEDLLRAMIESDEYTEYILDRRLGCRQLGMNLPPRVSTRKLTERYSGRQRQLDGVTIRSTYFQRDYVRGSASYRIHPSKYASPAYALRLAHVLGRAAAPNLIVGRSDADGHLIFDDGDEIVVEDAQKLPFDIYVADHTGTFGNFRGELADLAPHYAIAVNRRIANLPDPGAFADQFVGSFVERFEQIQAEYGRRRRAFDALFRHRRADPAGNLAFRWECVLKRLDRAQPRELAELIRKAVAI